MKTFDDKRFALMLFGVLPFICVGCSKFIDVEGVILVDGQAVEGMDIEFSPAEQGQEGGGMGFTDASGHYEMYTSRHQKGILAGEYVVRITPPEDEVDWDEEEGGAPPPPPMKIPAKYNRNSELTVEATRSNRVFDFNIDTTGGGE